MILFIKKSKFPIQKILQLIGLIAVCAVVLFSIAVIFSDNKLLTLKVVRKSLSETSSVIFGNRNHSVSSIGDLVKHAKGAWRGLITTSDYPHIDLQIDYKNITQLESTKYSKPRPYVNAKFVLDNGVQNNIFKSKVRYKGDRGIHVENFQKSSFRVNLKGDDRFLGLEEFSIQSPIVRNYSWEFLIRDIFSNEGLLTLNSHVVDFAVNGDNRGLFIVEEVPSTYTLERQSRKAGPIFGLDEDLGFGTNSNLDVYDAKSWKGSALYDYAVNQLYTQFLSIEKNSSINMKLFEMESWAKYFALTDIFGSYHGSLPKSVKFYFNPVSAKFEPLLFDAHLGGENLNDFIFLDLLTRGKSSECDWICPYESFYKSFLNNKDFLKSYIDYLKLYSSSEYIKYISDWYHTNYENLDNEFYSKLMAADGLSHRNINLYLFKFQNVTKQANIVKKRIDTFIPRSTFFLNRKTEKNKNETGDLQFAGSRVSVVNLNNFALKSKSWNFKEPTLLLMSGSNELSGLSNEEPLVITGPIMVVQKEGKIQLRNVEIRSGRNHKITNRNWSGVLNIFSSDANIHNLSMIDSVAEDAINIVSSDFYINNLEIINARSDAVDLDFAHGSIMNLECNSVGNDCFDVSESVVKVRRLVAKDVEDKGISAGENSNVSVDLIELERVGIGLVSKDGSELKIRDLLITSAKLPFSTFVKKSEYAEPKLIIDSIWSDQDVFALKSYKSILDVPDFVRIKQDVSSEIEGQMYGVNYGVATQK